MEIGERVSETTKAMHPDCSTTPPADWDGYVEGHEDSGPFQLAEGVMLGKRSFGLPAYFLTARDAGGTLRGVLPLVEQMLIPRTRCLVSLPFCTYGGVLADDDEAAAALTLAAERLAEERRAARLVLRQTVRQPAVAWPVALDKVSMILVLPASSEELASQLGSKLRSQIRRSDRASPVGVTGHVELLDDFYAVFCTVMRDLGTPVYPRRFFEAALAALGTRAVLRVIYLDGQPVSAAFMVHWHDSLSVPWAATLRAVNRLSINMRLYWDMLELAIELGCSRFDFGRSSPDSGAYRFKAQWGAEPLQLHWHSWAPAGKQTGAAVLENRSSFDLAVRLWSRLPLWLANTLGPYLSPRLPW